MKKITYISSIVLFLSILTACDSNPAEVNKSSNLNEQVQSERKVTKIDSLNLVGNAIEPGGDGASGISGCGTTTISFGTAGGTIETDYTPYELLTFISANSTNFNATIQLIVSLDGTSIGSGIGGFQVDEEVGLGTHTITVNATTYCSDGPSAYTTRQANYTIELTAPQAAPILIKPTNYKTFTSGAINFDWDYKYPYVGYNPPPNDGDLKFEVQLDYNDSSTPFENPVKDYKYSYGTGNTFLVPFDKVYTFQYRIRAVNNAGEGPWSEIGHFIEHNSNLDE